jgi:hypothetical protein
VRPGPAADAFVDQAKVLVDGSETSAAIAQGRSAVAASLAVPEPLLAAMRGRPTHAEPVDISAVWASGLPWHPLPVFQSYSAYTPSLDRRNAGEFAAADGPQRVLRRVNAAIDGRNAAWESPAAMRALLCHFRHLAGGDGAWEVLGRVANRCGAAVPLVTVKAQLGQAVPIPTAAPGAAVYVIVDGLQVRGLERLRELAYRSVTRTAVLDGQRPYRVLPETVQDGLLLRVPAAADSPGAFAFDQHASSIEFQRGSGGHGQLTLRFMAMPITA